MLCYNAFMCESAKHWYGRVHLVRSCTHCFHLGTAVPTMRESTRARGGRPCHITPESGRDVTLPDHTFKLQHYHQTERLSMGRTAVSTVRESTRVGVR